MPLWIIGLALCASPFVVPRLFSLGKAEDLVTGILVLALFQGVCLVLVGTGRRYWHFGAAALGVVVAAGTLMWASLAFSAWRGKVQLAAAQPELARQALAEMERVRQKYQASPNPEVQEALRTQVPATMEKTRLKYVQSENELLREASSLRNVFVLSIVLSVVVCALAVAYARSYRRLRTA